MILLLFLQVNIAMIRLRKKRPDLDRGFIAGSSVYVDIITGNPDIPVPGDRRAGILNKITDAVMIPITLVYRVSIKFKKTAAGNYIIGNSDVAMRIESSITGQIERSGLGAPYRIEYHTLSHVGAAKVQKAIGADPYCPALGRHSARRSYRAVSSKLDHPAFASQSVGFDDTLGIYGLIEDAV